MFWSIFNIYLKTVQQCILQGDGKGRGGSKGEGVQRGKNEIDLNEGLERYRIHMYVMINTEDIVDQTEWGQVGIMHVHTKFNTCLNNLRFHWEYWRMSTTAGRKLSCIKCELKKSTNVDNCGQKIVMNSIKCELKKSFYVQSNPRPVFFFFVCNNFLAPEVRYEGFDFQNFMFKILYIISTPTLFIFFNLNFSITAEHNQHDISRFVITCINIFVCCFHAHVSNGLSMIIKLFPMSHLFFFFFKPTFIY